MYYSILRRRDIRWVTGTPFSQKVFFSFFEKVDRVLDEATIRYLHRNLGKPHTSSQGSTPRKSDTL